MRRFKPNRPDSPAKSKMNAFSICNQNDDTHFSLSLKAKKFWKELGKELEEEEQGIKKTIPEYEGD
jgi:hypothetical protein